MRTPALRAYLAAVLFAAPVIALAQAPPASADYTRDLPSVQRIMTELKGSDATDTLAKQIAILSYLQTYISRIKANRDYRGPYTPGETRALTEYAQAMNQLQQGYNKAHTPDEAQALTEKAGQYEMNNALSWIKQMEGQQAADTYRGAERGLAQSYQQNQQRIQQQTQPKPTGNGIAGDPVLDPTGIFARAEANRVNDPKLRRCLELGSSLDACEGVNTMEAFTDLVSLGAGLAENPTGQAANTPPPVAGVVLAGRYEGRPGQAGLVMGTGFSNGDAVVIGCGALVDTAFDKHDYVLRRTAGGVQLVLANEPGAIVVTVQPDGTLVGPGPVNVKGRIVTGSTTTTEKVMVNGQSAQSQGYDCNGPCTRSSTIPTYGPKIERCTLGQMTPSRARPPPQQKSGIAQLDAITETTAMVTGFRMTGVYAGHGGLKLEFENDAVIIDCKRAHAKFGYAVDNAADGFVVRVQNGGGAFQLAVAPDGSLRGAGQTTINGRTVTAITGQNVSFAPVADTCPVGVLSANASRNTLVAGR